MHPPINKLHTLTPMTTQCRVILTAAMQSKQLIQDYFVVTSLLAYEPAGPAIP